MASFDGVCPPCLKIGLILNDSRLHVPATNESASVNNQEPVDPLRSLRQLVGDKNLKVSHLNINGLVNKLPEVPPLLEVANFNIRGITETHLNESVTENWVRTPGFNLVRDDRDNHGGGVLIYYKESLLTHQVTTWDHPKLGSYSVKCYREITVFSGWLYL